MRSEVSLEERISPHLQPVTPPRPGSEPAGGRAGGPAAAPAGRPAAARRPARPSSKKGAPRHVPRHARTPRQVPSQAPVTSAQHVQPGQASGLNGTAGTAGYMPVVPLSRPAPGTAKKKAKAKPKAAARDWPRLVAKARRVGLAVAAAVATGALVARAVADPRLRHWVATRATAGLHHGLFGLPWTLTAPLAGVFLAMLMVPLVVLGRLDKHDQGIKLLGRVGPYVPAAAAAADWSVASSAADVVTKVLRSRGTEQKLATRLDLAGIKRRPGEWVLLTCGVCLALAAGLSIVTGSLPLGLVGAVVVGWLGPRCVVSFLVNRRRSAFAAQLPEVLEIIAGSLQSGLTLNRALDTVVNQDLQPAATELSRAQSDQRLGAEMEDALDAVAERMASDDLAWTVIAIRIQKQVGGNMVEVLRTVVNTMRERAYLRRQVKSLSAEGRFSAYILIALPILIGGWLFYSSPSYMSPLYTTATGLLMLGGAVVMVVAGTMWMRKLIRIEV